MPLKDADGEVLAPKPTKVSKAPDPQQRISRMITACKGCRLRRVKCDRQFPKCSRCAKTNADCVAVDPETGEEISRVSIHSLETKLREVTDELNALKREKNRLASDGAEPLLARPSNEFKFGKVLLMKDNEIDDTIHAEAAIEIPARPFVEACIQSYFTLTNIQIPILHRDYFLFNYFKPLYGEVGEELFLKILGNNFLPEKYQEEPAAEQHDSQRRKCLFFLYIIIAILTSQHQQKYPLMISNHYKKQAFHLVDYVWDTDGAQDEELAKLEMMQSLLLLTQYSLMRPCSPGAWYLMGTCVRLCLDLGLHNEPVFLQSDNHYIVDLRRRLFWCCYSLDRQISVYFGRQFGIDSRQVDCPLLSTRDDLLLSYNDSEMSQVRNWTASQTDCKDVTIHFINLRVLQGEIFDYINDAANRVPKQGSFRFTSTARDEKLIEHDIWKRAKHNELIAWYDEMPRLGVAYHLFNEMIFKLNLNQTLIQLYGQSAITPVISHHHHMILFEAGQEIIHIYMELVGRKMINFSWVALNNLYMGSTVYLLMIMQSQGAKEKISLDQFKRDCKGVVSVFDELRKISFEPGMDYTNKFKEQSTAALAYFEEWIGKKRRASSIVSNGLAKSASESNVISHVGSNITPATLVAPVPQRSVSIDFQATEDSTDGFLFDNDLFLNTMMGSINAAAFDELDANDYGESLDPEYQH